MDQASDEIVKPPCICCDSQGKIYSTTDTDIPESIKLPSINNTQLTEPTSTQQVFIAEGTISEKERLQSTKIFEPDLPPKEREVSLKTAEGRYLTADPVKSGNGTLSGKATAISKPQYFKLIPQNLNKFERYTLWKIQTSWGQYIQLTPNEHKESRFDVRTLDRADEDGCNFVIRIHAKYQRDFDKLKKAAANDGKIIDEKYISSKVLRERAKRDLTKEEIKTLKHAYAGKFFLIIYSSNLALLTNVYLLIEGRLNEALLDLRQKSKTDTMC